MQLSRVRCHAGLAVEELARSPDLRRSDRRRDPAPDSQRGDHTKVPCGIGATRDAVWVTIGDAHCEYLDAVAALAERAVRARLRVVLIGD